MQIPENLQLKLGDAHITLQDDPHSDRIRCDHPTITDPQALAFFLAGAATCLKRGKILTMVDQDLVDPLVKFGYTLAGILPNFYNGTRDCGVLTLNLDASRYSLANPKEFAKVTSIIINHNAIEDEKMCDEPHVATCRAKAEDAADIANLIDKTFFDYPTPSHNPEYVLKQIEDGVPFRYIKENGEMIACASADLVSIAQTAELTDCATDPAHRKKGLMFSILLDLMQDLKEMGYKSAFTYSRSRVPGINVLFKKLGFQYCGQVHQSCRIGEGLEDMNMWIRQLPDSNI